MPNLLIVGSSNTDMVVSSPTLPRAGETLIGTDFLVNPGGKGANQAVAAARLGGRVTFVTRLGDDSFGRQTLAQHTAERIDTRYAELDENLPSGVAVITVDAAGENTIVVALGANAALSPAQVDRVSEWSAFDYALTQLETPLATVAHLAARCRAAALPLVLNPAPAAALPDDLLDGLYLITPNETEAEVLTGVPVTDAASAARAAANLRARGVANVVITLGARGAYLLTDEHDLLVAGRAVTAVDTTAAGDTFNGALVVALAEGADWPAAVAFANRAAALSVTRPGAQASVPHRHELT